MPTNSAPAPALTISIKKKTGALFGRWDALPAGATLELSFPVDGG